MLLFLLACRPDPIRPPNSINPYDTATEVDSGLSGSTPYEAGQERLSLGIFYEGSFSEEIAINDETSHFYIWSATMVVEDSSDCVEGVQSDQVTFGSNVWFGGGVAYDSSIDFAEWSYLHLALKSVGSSSSVLEVGMSDDGGEYWASVSDYGFVADGEWHDIVIPIADLTVDGLGLVDQGFMFKGETGAIDLQQFLLDDVYYTKEDLWGRASR